MGFMELLAHFTVGYFSHEFALIHWLQTNLDFAAGFFNYLCYVGDGVNAIYMVLPLALFWVQSISTGLRVVTATTIAEFGSLVLKSLFRADRPYWKTNQMDDQSIRQYEKTCETSFGLPSTHTILVVVNLLIVVDAIKTSRPVRVVLTTLAYFFIGLIMISRCFVGAHFAYQVFAGLVVGLAIVQWTRDLEFGHVHAHYAIISSVTIIFLTTTSIVVFGQQTSDSILLAKAHCQRAEWVHVTTSPLFVQARTLGSYLGFLVFAHTTAGYQQNELALGRSIKSRLLVLIGCSIFVRCLTVPFLLGHDSIASLLVFYLVNFAQWALATSCVLLLSLMFFVSLP